MNTANSNKRFRLTIGAKLIALIALLLSSSIAGIAYLSEDMYVANDKANIKSISASTTATKVQQVKDVMGGAAEKISFLGTLLAQDVTPTDVKSQFTKEFFDKDHEFLGIYVEKNDGNMATVTQKAVSPELVNIGDPDGLKLFEQLAADRSFSLGALFTGEPQTSLLKLSDGTWAVALGIPLLQSEADKSKFTHIAIAFVRQSKIGAPFKDPLAGEIYLVDRRGNVIAHSDPTRVGENMSGSTVIQQLFSGKQGVQSVEYNDTKGEQHLASFNFVKFSGTSLGVVSDVPATAAYEAATRIGRRSAYVGLIILFVAFWMGYMYSGTLTQPIKALVVAAQRIASGDFKINLKPKSRDEIAQLSLAFNDMAQGLEERDRVKETFNKFHNKEIAEKLLSGEVKLGGERKEATIFFSDVRGFTAMSETMEPEQVVEMLNEYMTAMVSIVRKHSGIVDKYVGDAIMALWGVPLSKEDDTYHAVRACLEMRQELAKLNELRISRGQHPLKIGMGLNVGPVIAGNIGSVEKMEYTVIGDSVNLASRMESMTKEYGTDLLIPSSIHEKVKDRFVFEKCKSAKVKGKSTAIEIYKVKGYIDADGKEVIIETAYSSYAAEKSDKVVHEEVVHVKAPAADPTSADSHAPAEEAEIKSSIAEEITSVTIAVAPKTELHFYLSMAGSILGPFSQAEVESGLSAKEFPTNAMVSTSEQGPWVAVTEHPNFAPQISMPEAVQAQAPALPPELADAAEPVVFEGPTTVQPPVFGEIESTIVEALPFVTSPEPPASIAQAVIEEVTAFVKTDPVVAEALVDTTAVARISPPVEETTPFLPETDGATIAIEPPKHDPVTLKNRPKPSDPSIVIDPALLQNDAEQTPKSVATPPPPPAFGEDGATVQLTLVRPPTPPVSEEEPQEPKAEDDIVLPILEDRPKVA